MVLVVVVTGAAAGDGGFGRGGALEAGGPPLERADQSAEVVADGVPHYALCSWCRGRRERE